MNMMNQIQKMKMIYNVKIEIILLTLKLQAMNLNWKISQKQNLKELIISNVLNLLKLKNVVNMELQFLFLLKEL